MLTVGALVNEGREWHHSVATYLSFLRDGDLRIASARVGGVRLTVEVAREPAGGLRIVDARGVANAPTTAKLDSALAFWIAAAESGRAPLADEGSGS